MEVTDLMVGDWVFNNFLNKNIRITPYDFFSKYPKVIEGNDLELIPLTGEILEKNGFKNYRLSYENGDYYYHVVLEDVKGGIWIEAISSRNILHGRKQFCGLINYVHELQHTLKQCGIEKDIVL